jgi:RHS repeat-associated protein
MGTNYNMARDYDPSTGRYIESDPIGQLLYFSLSNLAGASRTHRGYWNHLYNYVDNDPLMLKDPTGMGIFDRLLEWFSEKSYEVPTTALYGGSFGSRCISLNCGKNFDYADVYGICVSIMNDWMQKHGGAAAAGSINGVEADGGNLIASECAALCLKGIKSTACCKGKDQ